VDSRPSELDPYPRFRRDLGSAVLWEKSLHRSRARRERARQARRNAPRQKGVTLAAGAAILATPVLAPIASASSARPGVTKTEISQRAAVSGESTALLSYGDTGDAVAAVQHELGVVEDGIFGPITEDAVKSWQRGQGLAATGVVDARTWAGLFQAKVLFYDDSSSSSSSSPTSSSSSGSSSSGSSQPVSYGGPDSSTAPDTAAPSDGSSAPASPPEGSSEPVSTTPVSTGGDGCSTDGHIVTPVSGGTITSHYGEDRGDHIHSGTDIAVPTGTTVRAADCGTVSVSGTESGYGQMVCVRHAGDTTTCYAHLSERDVSVNEYVRAGQKIGEVGCTGNCTGPHVHFEVRKGGTAVNPDPYLEGADTVSGQAASMPADGSGGIGGATPKQQAEVFGDTGGATPKATLHNQLPQPATTTSSADATTTTEESTSSPATTSQTAGATTTTEESTSSPATTTS
jgi:Meckel syndrome type 1 protein